MFSKIKTPLRRGGESLAETKGFEPLIPLRVCLISSQVHSTTLPRLRRGVLYWLLFFLQGLCI